MHERTQRCVKDNDSFLHRGRRHLEEKMAQADGLSKGVPPPFQLAVPPHRETLLLPSSFLLLLLLHLLLLSLFSFSAFQKVVTVVVVNPEAQIMGGGCPVSLTGFIHSYACKLLIQKGQSIYMTTFKETCPSARKKGREVIFWRNYRGQG